MKRVFRLFLVSTLLAVASISCSAILPKPSDVATKFINYIADKNFDKAAALLSSKTINEEGGMDITKASLHTNLVDFKNKVDKLEVLSMNVDRENVTKAQADVDITTGFRVFYLPKGGPSTPEEVKAAFRFKLVEEGQDWKIDHIDMQLGPQARQTSPPAPTSTQTPSLDDEAVAAVKDLWEQHATKCEDSYFSSDDFRGINQYKNVSFAARRTGPTTEADRLNGVLWNGEVQIRTSVYRQKPTNGGGWSEWKEDRTMSQGWYNVGATKRASGWSVVELLAITDQRKIKCSEIPE